MAKTCAISWQMAKVPHGTHLCIPGCLYRLFVVCLQDGQTERRGHRRGGRSRPTTKSGGGRRRRQTTKNKGEAYDKASINP